MVTSPKFPQHLHPNYDSCLESCQPGRLGSGMKSSTLSLICCVAAHLPAGLHVPSLALSLLQHDSSKVKQRASADHFGSPRGSSFGSDSRQTTPAASSHITTTLTVHRSPLGSEPALSLKADFLISGF